MAFGHHFQASGFAHHHAGTAECHRDEVLVEQCGAQFSWNTGMHLEVLEVCQAWTGAKMYWSGHCCDLVHGACWTMENAASAWRAVDLLIRKHVLSRGGSPRSSCSVQTQGDLCSISSSVVCCLAV